MINLEQIRATKVKKRVLEDPASKSLMNVKYNNIEKQNKKLTNAPRNWDCVLGERKMQK